MYGPWWPVAAYNSTLQQHNLICCLQWRIQVDNDSSWWREEPGGGREKLGLCNDLDHRRQQQLRRRRPSARIEKNGSIAIDPFLAIINKLQLSPQSFGLLLASGYGRWAYVATIDNQPPPSLTSLQYEFILWCIINLLMIISKWLYETKMHLTWRGAMKEMASTSPP